MESWRRPSATAPLETTTTLIPARWKSRIAFAIAAKLPTFTSSPLAETKVEDPNLRTTMSPRRTISGPAGARYPFHPRIAAQTVSDRTRLQVPRMPMSHLQGWHVPEMRMP